MGKDKKEIGDGKGNSKTKETLIDDDVALTNEIKELDKNYKNIYREVQELSETYAQCKNHFPPSRYGDLKAMIKACVTDDILRKVALRHFCEEHVKKENAVGLLQAAEQFAVAVDIVSLRNEVSQLHKAEIIRDIEEKQERKDKLEMKCLRLRNRLQKLKRDYEESKHYFPARRYRLLKIMIKTIIRDDFLRPESL